MGMLNLMIMLKDDLVPVRQVAQESPTPIKIPYNTGAPEEIQ